MNTHSGASTLESQEIGQEESIRENQKNPIKREEKVISLSGIYALLLGIELYSYLAWRSDTVPESPTSSQKRTRSAAERDPRHDGI